MNVPEWLSMKDYECVLAATVDEIEFVDRAGCNDKEGEGTGAEDSEDSADSDASSLFSRLVRM